MGKNNNKKTITENNLRSTTTDASDKTDALTFSVDNISIDSDDAQSGSSSGKDIFPSDTNKENNQEKAEEASAMSDYDKMTAVPVDGTAVDTLAEETVGSIKATMDDGSALDADRTDSPTSPEGAGGVRPGAAGGDTDTTEPVATTDDSNLAVASTGAAADGGIVGAEPTATTDDSDLAVASIGAAANADIAATPESPVPEEGSSGPDSHAGTEQKNTEQGGIDQDKTNQDKTEQDMADQDKVDQGEVAQDKVKQAGDGPVKPDRSDIEKGKTAQADTDKKGKTGKKKPKRKPSRDEEISRKSSKAVPLALLIILAALVAVYCGLAHYYKDHFLPGSTINDVNVSGMEAAEAKAAIQADIRHYYLQVRGRHSKDIINSEGLGLTFANPEDVDTLLLAQDRWAWPLYFNKITDAELDLRWSVDEEALHERVSGMNAFKEENITLPTDAFISDSGMDTKEIVPETQGCQPDPDKIYSVIYDAVTTGTNEVDIDEAGCYMTPTIYRDDPKLNERLNQWNNYLRSVGLTYDYSDRKEVFDYDTLCSLLIDDGEKVYINEEAVTTLVQDWKQKYDTFGRPRQFLTHSGKTITVTGGDYGWVIKKADTIAEVISCINAGDNGVHTPPYSYKAKSRDTNDIGKTYVEISISDQRMWFYKNGECIVDTPIVTGNPNKGNSTLKGCYAIDAKKSPAVLKGQGYESHVVYWMPFNGNQGIHDADNWRSSYGGSIYLTNGSHGCVNTPRNKVKTIYEEVQIGTPVIVY